MSTSLFRITKTTLLALTAAAILAGPGHTAPLDAGQRARIIQDGGDLQALDRIQQGREFQRQEQRFREQDRQSNQQPQRLEVPRMQPSPSAVPIFR